MEINSINNVNIIKQTSSQQCPENSTVKNKPQQIKSLSNICYKPLSFGRTWSEHKSWGATIDPKTKEASFKLLTYPDTKSVVVNVTKKDNPSLQKSYELKNQGNGIFATNEKIPAGEVEHGDKYSFTIHKNNGETETVKDPYSFRQESLLGDSTVYDHSLYNWNDQDWFSSNTNRISRLANKQNGLKTVKDARIFEFNTASLTKKGDFESAKEVLKKLPDMGFNSIEIMPVENTYSFNWGYDGVDKMAPAEHLGGPDGLKDLIDYAHEQGLNVIMDMVPNHLGPDGAALTKTGPYTAGSNCFGEAINYEGKDSRYVRDFMVNAALNWIDNYHCDGLRLDMTKFMNSDYTMKQIAAEVNYHKPDAFLIAEDARTSISVDDNGNFWDNYAEPHDRRVTNKLKDFETGVGQSESVHCDAINKISDSNSSLGRLGFDSEWDFNYFHTLKDGLYGSIDLDAYEKACYCAQDSVKYIMSHDEIGNFEGSRLLAKLMVPMLQLNENVQLSKEDNERAQAFKELKGCSLDDAKRTVTFQKAQLTSEKLAIMLQTGELDKYDTSNLASENEIQNAKKAFNDEVLKKLGIKTSSGITYDTVKEMFNKSLNRNKMALARTYAIPGPKMIFQGDESADLTPFRFFRQFESVKNETYLDTEKGYKSGRAALEESTIGSIKYSKAGKNTMNKFKELTKDLNKLNEENPALTKGYLETSGTVKHQASQVFATHAKDPESNNEIFTVTNFNAASYPRTDADDYYIQFPEGEWVEVLNTDDKKYGGSGNYNNNSNIYSNGHDNVPIKLAGEATTIFKRIK